MRDRSSGHRIEVGLDVEPRAIDALPQSEAVFSIALFGDFSGRAHRDSDVARAHATSEAILVDRDNLDEVLALLRPELHVPLHRDDAPVLRVQFSSLDDFHPDHVYERLPLFEGVRALRSQLGEPAPPPQPPREPASHGSLLDDIVRQSPSVDRAADAPFEGGDLQAYLNRIVAPHVVSPTDPRRQAVLAKLEEAAANGLRALLHDAEFQALEALWLGVHLLTRAVESDTGVQLYLFDVTKRELAEMSRVQKLLAGSRWSVLAGLYSFLPVAGDLELLGRLGTIASIIGAPWLSAADPRLAGSTSGHPGPDSDNWGNDLLPAWQALRRTPEARWIGLALPRFLLRPPYGEQTSPCEMLRFEELSDNSTRDEYLWGNPTFACLVVLLHAVAEAGRPVHPGMSLEIGGLPVHGSQPCAETSLSERAAERILDAGLMPLVSIRDTDRIRLVRLQSIGDPPTPLNIRGT